MIENALILFNEYLSLSETLPITSSEAKCWQGDPHNRYHAPEKAYDGDVNTAYLIEDDDVEGNFLKLLLLKKYPVGMVKLINRVDCCHERIAGTVVELYSNEGGTETKVATCGEITGKLTSY